MIRRIFPFLLLLLSFSVKGENIYPVNTYQEAFDQAYSEYTQIPKGFLEAVSFTQTRFTHLEITEPQGCSGMPQSLTIFGLMADGQGWFRNSLARVAELTSADAASMIASPLITLDAYAKAADSLARSYMHQHPGAEESRLITYLALDLCELPLDTSAGGAYVINTYLYSIFRFLNDESAAGTYHFPQRCINLEDVFGRNNLSVLSSPYVILGKGYAATPENARFDPNDSPLSQDYPPALWTPAASCNYSSRGSTAISAVTIHTVQGSYSGCISWFQNCAASVSAHYVLRSSDGQVTQMVLEINKAWHVGSENPYTVGLEHEGYVSNAAWYTTAMYNSSAALVADICADRNINPLRTGWWPWLPTTYYNQSSIPGGCTRVKGHQHYPNQTHTDPGPNWNWNLYYKLINPTPAATVYTTSTGSFFDSGGASANYSDDERVIWTISPPNATSVTVNFSSFSVENTWDYLYIYDGPNINSPLLGYYTGTNNPGTVTSSSGSLTFEWRSDCATTGSGWNATWTSTINTNTTDITPPTSQININGIWQTQNFTATFTESDDAGGSGLEKSYYQVIDFDGNDWRANSSQGFFSDNFDQSSIHPEWTAATGTWSINNSVLEQSDENQTNTNIYAALTQNLSNRYLYHWAGKIDGTGNNRRAGFHFFCDNPAQTNRGNSYFVWFRVDQSACEFYEVINDTFYLRHSVPMTTIAGQWYDWKVIYDRITGKISVYQDNLFIGSWTDTTPYNNGSHVSFRSGNSNWQINNFKVYRSRLSNQNSTITVGNCASCMIRYQNTNPATPSGRVKSIVADSAGNLSAISYQDINVDWTVPAPVDTVYDGLSADIDLSINSTLYEGHWTPSSDTNSGLTRYYYALGTSPCDTDIIAWTSNWGYDTVSLNNLSLQNNITYYLSVIAENGAGLQTVCYISDGVLIDLTTNAETYQSGKITASASPVPATDATILQYSLSESSDIKISIYSSLGQQQEIFQGQRTSGKYSLTLNRDQLGLSSGVYFVSILTEADQLVIPVVFKD